MRKEYYEIECHKSRSLIGDIDLPITERGIVAEAQESIESLMEADPRRFTREQCQGNVMAFRGNAGDDRIEEAIAAYRFKPANDYLPELLVCIFN